MGRRSPNPTEPAAGAGGAAVGAPMSEINVTPFVDVMLCLLIIFMVAAPLMTVGVPIDLPDTSAEALPSEEEEPLTGDAHARWRCDGADDRGAMSELVARLQAVAAERDSTRIFLRADGAIPYERVMTGDGRAECRRLPRDRPCDRQWRPAP
jgi:biopolymer transport protein TolR